MQKEMRQKTAKYVVRYHRRRRWRKAVSVLACVVVFCTTYSLILPAITLENTVYCGMETHQHTEECYEQTLTCGQEEAEPTVHTHTEDCVSGEQRLICESEDPEHQHTEDCYETVETYTCGMEEGQEIPGHVHTEACYESTLACTLEEHTHTLSCYSNPAADVETPADWQNSVAAVELTGDWHSDLVAVAESQLGYTESSQNYAVGENETTKGYTRYGAWYGDPYGDWCAMFVSFCLNYADIPTDYFPREASCARWIEALSSEAYGLYTPAAGYEPVVGDLVFFDGNGDGASDHVGIVAGRMEDSQNGLAQIKTIEGNAGNQVKYVTYSVNNPTILGYALLPENPGNLITRTYAGEDYTVTVTYGPEAEIPEEAELIATEYAKDSERYQERYAEAAELYGWEEDRSDSIRLFDIGFYVDGVEVEPAAGVQVTISYPQQQAANYEVIHFGEEIETLAPESVTGEAGQEINFTLDHFSAIMLLALDAATPPEYTNTVSPSSSVINVFDYWVVDGQRFPQEPDGDGNINSLLNDGINSGHALKFRKNWGGEGTSNAYQGDGVVQGIVNKTLDGNGYPVLSGASGVVNGTESLAYLFDPGYSGGEIGFRKVFRGVQGLLYDENGYYTYNSTQHYAYLNEANSDSTATESGNKFTLYDTWAVTNKGNSIGQFFPFNDYSSQETLATDVTMNHYFGVTLTARFMQEYDGYTNASKSTHTTFHFSGDDDVWIFIDDVLVADLGGIHNKISTDIDFSTGSVEIYYFDTSNQKKILHQTTIKAAFTAAGRSGDENWRDNTFANDTSHILKFFYLERGNGDSNMSLQYNLNEIPPTAIYKVNQYGDPVAGAEFEVYRCDAGWNVTGDGEPVYTGTTDTDGKMVFADQYGYYSLADMEEKFGNQFILKETKVPDGYRLVSDEVRLRIQGGALVCDNTYQSGVWASPTVQVTAPNTLVSAGAGEEVPYYTPAQGGNQSATQGTLFAVVLKYNGSSPASKADLQNQANWKPVYGNPEEGYTLVDVNGGTGQAFVEAVIEAARQYKGHNVFAETDNGVMQVLLEDLPGKVVDYYHMLSSEGNVANTQYTIGYYWTEAASLADATSTNTYRVDAENETNSFYRIFGANIEVPNLANRLLVQKYDEDGTTLVNGATFALFEVNEQGQYRTDDGVYVDLVEGQYTVAVTDSVTSEDGKTLITPGKTVITTSGGKTITSHEQRTTNSQVLENSDGTCVFGIWGTNLTPGCYYLREVKAPEGYKINPTPIMVRVTEDTIYANAGTAEDGVTVARGPGYIVSPLHKAASEGDVDNTLTWIYQQLKVSEASGSFADASETAAESWDCAKNEDGKILTSYLRYVREAKPLGTDRYVTNYEIDEYGDRQEQDGSVRTHSQLISTDVGWSYNEIYQDTSYGQAHAGSANYTEITDPITSLFSRSVYVQVTDEKVSDLEISKTVQDAPADSSQEFTFTVSVAGADGAYDYAIYSIGDRTTPVQSGTLTFSGGAASITLKHNQVAVIKDLPGGASYTVTETKVDRYSPAYSIDGGESTAGSEASGTLNWNSSGNRVTQVAFTNAYVAPLNLTLQKYETGTNDKPLSGAEFVLYTTGEATPRYYKEATGTLVTLSETEKPESLALATDERGQITFKDLPDGSYALEEIKAPDGYLLLDAPINFTVSGGKVTVGPPNQHTDDTITVYNSAGVLLPETGGPGTTLYTIGGLLTLGVGFLLLYRKKRYGKGASVPF